MQPKEFTRWCEDKEIRHGFVNVPKFEEGDVWHCSFGINIGFEQDGVGEKFLRPVVIVRKYNDTIFLGIPLSHTDKDGGYFYQFNFKGGRSTAILSQMRLMDARRLEARMGKLSDGRLEKIRKRLAILVWRGVSELLPPRKRGRP